MESLSYAKEFGSHLSNLLRRLKVRGEADNNMNE